MTDIIKIKPKNLSFLKAIFYNFLFFFVLLIVFLVLINIFDIPSLFIFMVFYTLFFIGFILISIIQIFINKFSQYIITKDFLEIEFNFFSKEKSSYELSKIVTLFLREGFFDRKFNLGTIKFGIYGNEISSKKDYSLITILNPRKIYNNLKEKLNLVDSNILYQTKPSLKVIDFYIVLFSISFIIALFISFLFVNVFIIPFTLFLLIIIFKLYKSKTKNTQIIITKDYFLYKYNYLIGKGEMIIPIKEITNIQVNKGFFEYNFFGLSDIIIQNSSLFSLGIEYFENSQDLINILNNLISKNKINKISKNDDFKNKEVQINNHQISNHNYNSNNLHKNFYSNLKNELKEEKDALEVINPSTSFIIDLNMFLIFIFFQTLFGIFILSISLTLIVFIYKLILKNSTKYLFYEDRLITKTGILNKVNRVMFYKDIKYIKLNRKMFFNKFFKTGSIFIYSPSSIMYDINLLDLKEFDLVYKKLKYLIEN